MISTLRLTLLILIATLLTVPIAAEEQQPAPEKSPLQKGTPTESIVINQETQNAKLEDKNENKEDLDLSQAKVEAEDVTAEVQDRNEAEHDEGIQDQSSAFGELENMEGGKLPDLESVTPFNSDGIDLGFQNDNSKSSLGSFSQNVQKNGDFSTQSFNSLEDETLHTETEVQVEKEKQWEKGNNEQLNPWISQEIDSNVYPGEEVVMQTFQVYLQNGKQFVFRWNPPKSQTLHLKIMNFELLDDGALMMLQNNEKDEFVEVSYRDEGRALYKQLGNVYIEKSFVFDFDTDLKYFKLINHLNKGVMVIVDLERLQEVVNIKETVKNDNFTLAVKKLQVIHDEVVSGQKLREHSYKYQWGFLDNQYAHDSRLLGLTGLELLVMIAAAIIQVYFIKSLLDNRAVV